MDIVLEALFYGVILGGLCDVGERLVRRRAERRSVPLARNPYWRRVGITIGIALGAAAGIYGATH